jgi:hypothetical protein
MNKGMLDICAILGMFGFFFGVSLYSRIRELEKRLKMIEKNSDKAQS